MSNIKAGDRVRIKLLDKNRTKTIGTVTEIYGDGKKCALRLAHGFKCWSPTKDVTKVS
jgi:hypothetical protein